MINPHIQYVLLPLKSLELVSGLYFEALVNGANYLLKLYRGHRAFNDLKTFSDEQLCDIGLTRQDIYSIEADYYFNNPTIRLRDLVNDRRNTQLKSINSIVSRNSCQ